MEDWKDKLSAAFGVAPVQPEEDRPEQEAEAPADARVQQGNQVVHVLLDKKGRKGKTATLIVDLVADDRAIDDLARELKRQLGVGGSARGGEILIQGDHRDRVMEMLRNKGFKVK